MYGAGSPEECDGSYTEVGTVAELFAMITAERRAGEE